MSKSILISLPIYLPIKKNKMTLIGMNWYRNEHFSTLNKVKKIYKQLIQNQIVTNLKFTTYNVEAILYYKNARSDLDNSISVILKFVNDALQELDIVTNDNVNNFIEFNGKVGGLDKTNPRLEIIITGEVK